MLVRFVGHKLESIVRNMHSASAGILSSASFPGLEEAAKVLLSIWNTCEKVDVSALLVWTHINFPSNALLKRWAVSLTRTSRNTV